jgi:para-aminobenzoate synthetase/4-amino-4-deoxychorismate lyase
MFDFAVVRDPKNQAWLRFTDCRDFKHATRHEDVVRVIDEVERDAREGGLHAVGYVSYEAGHAFDPKFERQSIDLPLVAFGLFARVESVSDASQLTDLVERSVDHGSPDDGHEWVLSESQISFETKVEKIREHIAAGEVYQINLTSRLASASRIDFSDFLRLAQDMPYAAFLEGDEFSVVSASPELFFSRIDGQVVSKPMKGTVKRGVNNTKDAEVASWLHASAKNRAENVMITDMVRNDMARLSDNASVNVPSLFTVERYPSVWQMTSTVVSKATPTLTEIFTALFPAASITGAPKHAAMKLITQLEDAPREIYTGAIGHVSPCGDAVFNVAIRTAWWQKEFDHTKFGVGCGIIWDSVPTDEFHELDAKARILSQPSPDFHLFETMKVTDQGVLRLPTHLDRLEESARYWNFIFNRASAEHYLTQVLSEIDRSQGARLRLTLDRNGVLSHAFAPLPVNDPPATPVQLKLVTTPISSADPFLSHKTSHRAAYARADSEVGTNCAPLLFNEQGNVTESSIANVVYQFDGKLYTPPVQDGLLPGVFRECLVREGQVEVRSLAVEETAQVEAWWVVNALRGWRDCQLVTAE